MCRNIRQQTGNKGFPPFIGGKETKNGKLRSVQHEDVIYTERICIKYQSRLNQGSLSLQWDSMTKGGGVSTFLFLVVLLIIRQVRNHYSTTWEELALNWNYSWTTITEDTIGTDNALSWIILCNPPPFKVYGESQQDFFCRDALSLKTVPFVIVVQD